MKEIELKGYQRREGLKNAKKVWRRWNFMLPKDKVLALDFGLKDFSKFGHIEYWIVNQEKENYCGKFIFMFKGQTCPAHCHKRKHETFFILNGKVKMIYNNSTVIMKPGDTLVMPQKIVHQFTALKDSLILEVSQSSKFGDNFFQNKKIGLKGLV